MRVTDALSLYACCGAAVLVLGTAALLRVLPALQRANRWLLPGLLAGAGLLLAAAYRAPLRNGDEAANTADAVLLALGGGRLPHYTHPLLPAQLSASLWALWLQTTQLAGQLPERALEVLPMALRLARLPAVLGTLLLVGVVARWAQAVRGPRAGWLAALLVLLGPASDLYSAVSPHPLAAGFGALALFLAASRRLRGQSWLVGLAGGLAAASHGFGALHAALAGGLLLGRTRSLRDALQLLLAFGAVLALVHPAAWQDRDAIVAMLRYRLHEVREPEFAHLAHTAGPDLYLRALFESPLVLLAAVLAPPVAQRWLWRALVLGWLLLLTVFATRFSRYLLHVWPWLSLLAACGLDAALERVGQWRPRWQGPATAVLGAALLATALHGPIRYVVIGNDRTLNAPALQALRGQAVQLQTDCLGSLSVAPRAGLLPSDWPQRAIDATHARLGTQPAVDPGARRVRVRCDARDPAPGWQVLYQAGAFELSVQ